MNGTLTGNRQGWIGVDLDGTLAFYDTWRGSDFIGHPIPLMVERVIKWITEGREVRVVTARVHPSNPYREVCRKAISAWVEEHVFSQLPLWFRERGKAKIQITHEKDFSMVELWDDRCVQVIPNTGKRADGLE